MQPEISNNFLVCQLQVGPFHTHLCFFFSTIEDRYSSCATRKRASPDLLIARLPRLLSLFSKLVLIDCNHLFVCKYLNRRRRRIAQIISGKKWRGLNRWPSGLPGFRDTMLLYFRTMEALGQQLLAIYALALDLPRDYFLPLFDGAHINLRLSHYPANAAAEDNQFGIAPHADAGFLTMLPQSAVPGLEIRTASGRWLAAPSLPGSYLVNTGDTLNRWTNGRFLSTPHRASNKSGEERYAMPFFYDPNTDTMIECLPTCQGPNNPPKHQPQTYGEFYAWFVRSNYKNIREIEAA